ncbi:hypothetical protein AMATHDRAFT_122232, partial [Amanita thiersii Skay4041]
NDHPSFGDFDPEDVIHHSLKSHQGIEHYQRFKQTPICPERSLPLITFLYLDIVVPPADVHFREIFCLGQFV